MACPESRLKCFLHYGCEDRLYVPNRNIKYMFNPNEVKSVLELLTTTETDKNVVSTIMKVFQNGYIIEPCASMFALAMVVRKSDPKTKNKIICEAYRAARKLSEDSAECFLMFTHYLREIAKLDNKKGFGKGWRITVQKWYGKKDPLPLAETVSRVSSVNRWSHKDVLKLSRLKAPSEEVGKAAVLTFVQKGFKAAFEKYSNEEEAKEVLDYLKLVDQIRKAESDAALINLITVNGFTIEYCPLNYLTNHEVWLALIPRMSIECLLSNLNRMSKLKLFRQRPVIQEVVKRFSQQDEEMTNIHPIFIYVVRKQYEEGPNLAIEFQFLQRQRLQEVAPEAVGDDDSLAAALEGQQHLQRQPPPRRSADLIDALASLFSKSVSCLPPSGLRYLIAIDMTAALPSRRCFFERFVSVEEAALLVTLCVVKAELESNVKVVSFMKDENKADNKVAVREVPVNKTEETLDSLKGKLNTIDAVNAHVQYLFEWATNTNEAYDVVIVLSDNHLLPQDAQGALKVYQEKVSPKAKLICCSFTGPHRRCKELTKEDMFLICGFDKNVGRLIEACSRGSF